jgi:hypothetical protein
LRHKKKRRVGVIALELTKQANFVTFKVVDTWISIFPASDIEVAVAKVDLVPLQVAQLRNPKGMVMAVLPGSQVAHLEDCAVRMHSLHQLGGLLLLLALGILAIAWRNFPL